MEDTVAPLVGGGGADNPTKEGKTRPTRPPTKEGGAKDAKSPHGQEPIDKRKKRRMPGMF